MKFRILKSILLLLLLLFISISNVSADITISDKIFVPTDIPGCVLWLRSDTGVTKDGFDKVSVWADQSGNGHNVLQATGDNQPLWVASQLIGYPAIRFDGINDFMASAAFTLNQPEDVYIVFRWKTGIIHGGTVLDGIAANNLRIGWMDTQTAIHLGVTWAYDGIIGGIGGMSKDVFAILEFCANEVPTQFQSVIKVNGGANNIVWFAATSPGSNNAGGITLGNCPGNPYWAYVDIIEVIIYNSALSNTNSQRVKGYLRRYGIY